MKKSYEVLRK